MSEESLSRRTSATTLARTLSLASACSFLVGNMGECMCVYAARMQRCVR